MPVKRNLNINLETTLFESNNYKYLFTSHEKIDLIFVCNNL